jgi:replication protein P
MHDKNQKPKLCGTLVQPEPLGLIPQELMNDPKKSLTHRIDQLFLKMSIIYPYRWNGQFPNREALDFAKLEWQEGLADLTDEEIKRGLNYCRKEGDDFPPSIPAFRKFCLPTAEELGFPFPEEAYRLAVKYAHEKNWKHNIIYKTVEIIGFYEFNNGYENKIRPRFIKIYKHLLTAEIAKHREKLTLFNENQNQLRGN